jgi:hypothetical protein
VDDRYRKGIHSWGRKSSFIVLTSWPEEKDFICIETKIRRYKETIRTLDNKLRPPDG